jgi:hypothetical protein
MTDNDLCTPHMRCKDEYNDFATSAVMMMICKLISQCEHRDEKVNSGL